MECNNPAVAKIGTEQIVKAFSKTLTEREANDMAKTTAEELLITGRAEGEVKGKFEALLTILQTRFKKVPKRLETEISKMTDTVALQSWIADEIKKQVRSLRTINRYVISIKSFV